MRILYCAIDQAVPGTKGGSVHVIAVAEGLAKLGHEVHVLAAPGDGPAPSGLVHWTAMRPPFGVNQLRWLRSRAVRQLAASLRPDVIIERYYNFGGEGILAGRRAGALTVLEVNAPVIDYPGSSKALVDRALIVEPMRRWRERLCRLATLIVTPDATILPKGTPAGKVMRLEWGADTDRFHPAATGAPPFARPPGTVAIFAGAFRRWHGAIDLVRAIKILRAQNDRRVSAVLVGDGPELPHVRREAEGVDGIVFTGALPHDRMPAALAAADVGVAPFDVAAHAPLSLAFYWSPLKVFEYMSSGLPVVAPRIRRIASLVSHNDEGILYDPPTAAALAGALTQLSDPSLRETMGRRARDRALREYGWDAHCRALDAAFRRAREATRAPN
jgi:starch synthase